MTVLVGSGADIVVRAASTANLTIGSNAAATLDGVTLAAGDRVLIKDQTTAAENGIYVFVSTAAPLARAGDYAAAATLQAYAGQRVRVREGAANAQTVWGLDTTGTITIATTGIAFSRREPDPNASRLRSPFAPTGTILENLTDGRYGATNSGVTITSGVMRFYGLVYVPAGVTVTTGNIMSGATAGATLSNSWMGLVRVSDRALVAVSTSNATAAWAVNTVRSYTLSYTPTQPTLCWVAMVVVGTTMPTFWGSPAPTGGVVTALTAQAPVLEGTSTTGLTTPQALATVETAPTATAAGVAYVWFT